MDNWSMTREAGIYNEEKTYDVRETGQLHAKKKKKEELEHFLTANINKVKEAKAKINKWDIIWT